MVQVTFNLLSHPVFVQYQNSVLTLTMRDMDLCAFRLAVVAGADLRLDWTPTSLSFTTWRCSASGVSIHQHQTGLTVSPSPAN